jgi:hypothetical protein
MITTQLMNLVLFAAISDCRVAAAAAFYPDYSRTSLQEQSLNENIFETKAIYGTSSTTSSVQVFN